MSKAVLIPECNKDVGGIKEEICISPNEKKDGMIGLFSRFLRFDSLKKPSPESPTATDPSTIFYGVYIPCEIIKGPDEKLLHVYENKSEALDLVRRYKSSRFKAFRNYQDALSFALRGAEPAESHDGNGNTLVGEKPYPFKAPTPQDMVALRKAIEAGLTTTVQDRVWDNPRYLVSSGNTPAIVQEGARYNALHIAAKASNAEICNLLLNTVGNPAFVQALYGMDANPESCKEFASILVDRYLNTPDKGLNETPLHFAAKFGAEHVVDVLTSFPQCNKNAKNKHGELPKDIICSRAPNTPSEVSAHIAKMLLERYYVPVLHSEDDSAAPTIGKPFTPADPPELNQDPLSPRYEIRAFAGPMPPRDAEQFRRKWKTPPRGPRTPQTPTDSTCSPFRLRDLSKGLESVGRNLAEEMNVGWKEYWPFLDTFTDLRSPEGLALLENYLKAKYETAYSFAQNDSLNQTQAEELNLSRISLGNLSQSPIQELSPISELCVAMKTCKITDKSHWRKTDPIRQRMCRQPTAKSPVANGDTNAVQTSNHTVNQLLCIERTCQVFAKRIADALIFSLSTEPEVAGESLKSEAKHLQHTIYTYMDDERFKDINFSLIHSRLAQLVVFKLKQQTKELDDINNLVEFLIKLRCPNDDIFSSDDERKPFTYRTNRMRINHVIDGHVRCLSSFICEELTESDVMKGPAVSDGECREIWEKAGKCRCDWKVEVFERNSKKNASFRKNRSMLSTSPKSESFIKRLTFEHDIGDGKCQTSVEKPVSRNSPAGDGASTPPNPPTSPISSNPPISPKPSNPPALYSLDVAKCLVLDAEISEDDSSGSGNEESYHTASEHFDSDAECDMQDASDRALTEPFIYGEEPSKMDRLVFDAVSTCQISPDTFPNIYRWRHTVALYTDVERQRWQPASSNDTTVSWPDTPRAREPLCSTPRREARDVRDGREARDNRDVRERARAVPLQVSNWLRVTGPNSPRSAAAAKNVGHNVSFGF